MNTTIFGALGLPDTDYSFINTLGQEVVYDGTMQVLSDHNADMAFSRKLFIERDTIAHAMRYKLEGAGRLQETGNQSRAAEVKAGVGWDVGFPLKNLAAAAAADRVTYAYMRLEEYSRTLRSIMNMDRNTLRYEILRALFNNTSSPVQDGLWPTITVQPLANGDATVYPPLVGSEQTLTSQHYLGVPASAVALTDSNNPIAAMVNVLEGHFGTPTFGSDIVIFCNNAQTAGFQGLSGFEPIANRFVRYGANQNLVNAAAIPPELPGRVLGEVDSALIVEWRFIPSGYLFGMHLGAERPLMRRVDDPQSGLMPDLQLVAEDIQHPFERAEWINRYGIGVSNRLNGVVVDLTATGGANTYTIPTQYS